MRVGVGELCGGRVGARSGRLERMELLALHTEHARLALPSSATIFVHLI